MIETMTTAILSAVGDPMPPNQVLFVVLAVIAPARADFATGWEAYRDGDYAAAPETCLPPARRGDIDALYDLAAPPHTGMPGAPHLAIRPHRH